MEQGSDTVQENHIGLELSQMLRCASLLLCSSNSFLTGQALDLKERIVCMDPSSV